MPDGGGAHVHPRNPPPPPPSRPGPTGMASQAWRVVSEGFGKRFLRDPSRLCIDKLFLDKLKQVTGGVSTSAAHSLLVRLVEHSSSPSASPSDRRDGAGLELRLAQQPIHETDFH